MWSVRPIKIPFVVEEQLDQQTQHLWCGPTVPPFWGCKVWMDGTNEVELSTPGPSIKSHLNAGSDPTEMAGFRAVFNSPPPCSITIIGDISGSDQRRQRCEMGAARCDISRRSSYMAVGHGTDCTPARGRQAAGSITGSILLEEGGMRFAYKQLQMKHNTLLLYQHQSCGHLRGDCPSIITFAYIHVNAQPKCSWGFLCHLTEKKITTKSTIEWFLGLRGDETKPQYKNARLTQKLARNVLKFTENILYFEWDQHNCDLTADFCNKSNISTTSLLWWFLWVSHTFCGEITSKSR